MLNIIEVQKQLLAVASPSGRESKTAEVIKRLVQPFCDEVKIDRLGNLIALKKATTKLKGNKVMVAAHMDTIGLMAMYIDDKGFIFFDTLGGFYASRLIGMYFKFENGTIGVVRKVNDDKDVSMSSLYIDIGAKDKAEAAEHVSIGDTAIYCGELRQILNNKLIGPYMDDLIGCSILICAMSELKTLANDVYFTFTVQEETGLTGAKTSSYGIEPDWAFCVDVTGAGDYPEANKPLMPTSLGKGACIKIRDGSLICNKEIVQLLKQAAEDSNIPYQLEVLRSGGTDSGAIQISRAGVLSGGISLATRYIHTHCEMVDLFDIECCIKLICQALQRTL